MPSFQTKALAEPLVGGENFENIKSEYGRWSLTGKIKKLSPNLTD